jgi:hypothetical protein
MTYDDADLAAVRETVAARVSDPDRSLSRSWATITADRPTEAWRPTRRPARWLVPVGAAATVAALAAGTTVLLGGGDDGVTPADLRDFPRITDPSQIVFPIDEYDFTTDGYVMFQDALAHLIADCVRRFGVDPPDPEREGLPTDLPDFDTRNHRLYGVFDRDMAASWGYRTPPDWGTVRPTDVSEAKLAEVERLLRHGLREPEFAAPPLGDDLNGDPLPEGGCEGEATRTLSEGLPDPDFRITNNDSQERAWGDERVRTAEAAWSDCMRQSGYDYESIWEPGERIDYQTDEPTATEIADAVANVACKIETNLVGVLVGVTSELEEAFIQENWAELQQLKLWLDTVYRNSEQVLAEVAEAD